MRWDPGLPKTAVPGSRLLIAAYFEVWLYQGGPGSAPRSTGRAAHSRHSGLALSSSAAGCLVPGQRSHSTSQPPPWLQDTSPAPYRGARRTFGTSCYTQQVSVNPFWPQFLVAAVGFSLARTKGRVNLSLKPGQLHPIPLEKSVPANETT